MSPVDDPHKLELDDFHDEVHSFEFWFQSVEGYLTDRHYGRSADVREQALDDTRRERIITTLCNYCVGETAALEGASGLIIRAPNRQTQIFLATQAVDEARHLEVLQHRLRELGVRDVEAEIARRASPTLSTFKTHLSKLVLSNKWEEALFAQNVILEVMEFTVFNAHVKTADPVTKELLEGIISDERRHMGFGENELGRRLARDDGLRDRLELVRRELDPLILKSFNETLTLLGVSADEEPNPGKSYLAAIDRLGFTP